MNITKERIHIEELEALSGKTLRVIITNAYRNARRLKACALWAVARDIFGVGSTTAWKLCRKAGLDPDSCEP
jgi:hypothetical protein